MMVKSNIKLNRMSDNAFVEILGGFIKQNRLLLNKSQAQLAEEAGIDRSTLLQFEKGKRSNIITFIQLLRALNQLQVLQQFEIKPQLSPMQLAKLETAKRKRASTSKKAAVSAKPASKTKNKSNW